MINNNAHLTLGDLELEVLECLWTLQSGDVSAVLQAMGGSHHHNTVQSAMERLFRKGLLGRKKQSHAFFYTPSVSREDLVALLLEKTLQRVKGVEPLPLLMAFVDMAAEHDHEVLEKLEQLLASRRTQKRDLSDVN